MFLTVFSAVLIFHSVLEVVTQDEPRCFVLDGMNDSYVTFTKRSDVSYNFRFHFRLEFKTSADNELIYYNEGEYEADGILDYEGVFIKNGLLSYFGFNPSPYGAGTSFGSFAQSNFTVNNNTWIQLEFFRNVIRPIQSDGEEEMATVTGMVVNGHQFLSLGRERQQMDLGPHLFIGGHGSMQRISRHLSTFSGTIRNFYDVANKFPINEPVEHVGRYATSPCTRPPPPS